MKVLITGHRGFIGTHLYRRFLLSGYDVVGVDRSDGGDVLDLEKEDIEQFDTIIHLAAQTSVQNDNIRKIVEDNITSFIHVFELCKKCEKKFIYASSSCAYNITSMYGISKQMNEEYARCYGWPGCVGLRLHNVYGPEPRKNTLLGKCLAADEITLYHDGNNMRHFTEISDVCEAIERAISMPAGLYNVACPEEKSVREFVAEVMKYKDLKINFVPERMEYDKEKQEIDETLPNIIRPDYIPIERGIKSSMHVI